MRLQDKVAVITGGGSGLGQASAVLFAREGARIVVVDRDAAGGQATVAQVAAAGGEAMALVSDVGEPGSADRDAAAVLARFGRIDVLCAFAGFSCGGTVLTTDPADWDAVFRANVGGTWLWARAVIPAMQRQGREGGGGSIVTTASQLALAGGRGNTAYIAAKGAILSLTRTMALDFAADGIRVNALVPGAIDTPLLRRSFARHAEPEPLMAASRARHAMGRFGRAQDVAEAALFLASDAAAFTTGTTLAVDGGWLAA
jgi:2-keto-3-deoxy-L-fuconate dehydrogenase